VLARAQLHNSVITKIWFSRLFQSTAIAHGSQ